MVGLLGFKPYYNWNTFNTKQHNRTIPLIIVLNLIITGIPSILKNINFYLDKKGVLNLIITGIPSILKPNILFNQAIQVLNLIITGIPSILSDKVSFQDIFASFKPYYNWNTFNTAKWAAIGFGALTF